MPYYALHDYSQALRKAHGAFRVDDPKEAVKLNLDGYGIFITPNSFRGARSVANLTKINFWFAELDEGTKKQQERKIRKAPLLPSVVVESKNGFHAYWRAVDATLDTWKRIVRWGIVPALGGDVKATDVARLLRAPTYYHCKHKEDRFLVKKVWETQARYTEQQMMEAFPDVQKKIRQPEAKPKTGHNFLDRTAQISGLEAIPKLSGHWLVNGEEFRLEPVGNGNHNIIRVLPSGDERDTGSFVDREGYFGNVRGGPTVNFWCKWYGWSWKEVAKGLKELWPELS